MTEEQHGIPRKRSISKILKKNFAISLNQTWDTRYDEMGIIGYIRQYANTRHEALNVIDVGCSNGTAAKTAQECLKKHGICIKTTGIDSSPSVKSDAIKNLDCFVQADVVSSKTDMYVGYADVVICANVGSYLYKLFSPRDTAGIIGRCSEFLKKDGILVTDAPDANSAHGISRLDWQCVRICPKPGLNLDYKLGSLRKSSAYRRI